MKTAAVAAIVVCSWFLPGIARAQEGVIKNLSMADFEKIIRDDLKKDFAKKDITGGVCYDIKGTDYYADFSSVAKVIMFYALADGRNVTLTRLNDWNKDAIFSRAYVVNDKIHFEVALSFAGGITRDTIKDYYERTEVEWKQFNEKVLKANN